MTGRSSIIPKERRILMRKITKLKKRIASANSARMKRKLSEKLTVLEAKLADSHKRERDREEANAVRAIASNPKYFYTYAKSKSRIKTQVGPLSDGEGGWCGGGCDGGTSGVPNGGEEDGGGRAGGGSVRGSSLEAPLLPDPPLPAPLPKLYTHTNGGDNDGCPPCFSPHPHYPHLKQVG